MPTETSDELLPKVAAYIEQLIRAAGNPSVTKDEKLVADFKKAVRDGKVPEFFDKHPNLSRDDFYALYRMVGEEEREPEPADRG